MGRHKTISDERVLQIARDLFGRGGHTVTTRQVADAAGISEAILYQRFGSKDDLFFAAMRPREPDIDEMLGPAEPTGDPRHYLRTIVVRIADYFGTAIPLALRVITHPSFDQGSLARAHPTPAVMIRERLTVRFKSLARCGKITAGSEAATADVLVSLAHDWALNGVLSPASRSSNARLIELIDVIWNGIRPHRNQKPV
jgi:AcrR family transcriptional regulator